MKILVYCAFFLSATWAVPKGTNDLHFRNVYVEPAIDFSTIDLTPRITGGTEVVPHSIPYQAYLIVTATNGNRWLCGGALITSKHVLTAGHCVDDAVSAVVYLGAHNIQEDEESQIVVHSESLICHEDFNATPISDDIGLIVLDREIVLSKVVDTVALPQDATDDYEGVNARVSGWGRTSWEQLPSAVLLEVNSTVLSNTECGKTFHDVLDSQVCISGNGGAGACRGDSGGPLVYNNALIGVVSYGARGCPDGYPSAFTRVTSYLDWIEEKVNATSSI